MQSDLWQHKHKDSTPLTTLITNYLSRKNAMLRLSSLNLGADMCVVRQMRYTSRVRPDEPILAPKPYLESPFHSGQ